MVPGSRVRVPFFHLVELGSSHCVEAVAGDFVLGTAKTAQPAIDCVLGHGALCRTKLRKQESAWPCVSLNLRDDCQRLLAKREGGAAEQLGLVRRDRPDCILKITLAPFGMAQFAGADDGKDESGRHQIEHCADDTLLLTAV